MNSLLTAGQCVYVAEARFYLRANTVVNDVSGSARASIEGLNVNYSVQ